MSNLIRTSLVTLSSICLLLAKWKKYARQRCGGRFRTGNSKHRKRRLYLADQHARITNMSKNSSHEIRPILAYLETVVQFGFGDVKMVDRALDGFLKNGPSENRSLAR